MKSQNPITVTIGIPAFNEESSIVRTLEDLLSQQVAGFVLEKIIVMSDGSSDETVERARSVRDERIEVIDDKRRMGKPERINQIFEMAYSNVIALFDADITIQSKDMLSELVRPFVDQEGVVASFGSAHALPPITVAQKIFKAGWDVWYDLRTSTPGSEMYRCEGTIRAFHRDVYTKMRFPNYSADDVFPYLYCKKHGYNVAHTPSAKVYYTLPATLKENINQTVRSLGSEGIQNKSFDEDFVSQFYVITFWRKVRALVKHLIINPIWMSLYVVVLVVPKVVAALKVKETETSLWKIARTSKKRT